MLVIYANTEATSTNISSLKMWCHIYRYISRCPSFDLVRVKAAGALGNYWPPSAEVKNTSTPTLQFRYEDNFTFKYIYGNKLPLRTEPPWVRKLYQF